MTGYLLRNHVAVETIEQTVRDFDCEGGHQ